jgi:hypothetical protein
VNKVGYLLPVLGCAAMMGAMMWMMRGRHAGRSRPAAPALNAQDEIAVLRAEVAALRDQHGGQPVAPDEGARS